MDAIIEELKLDKNKPVIIANHQGCITFVNGEFEKLFGWTSLEIFEKPILTIIPRALHDAHNIGFSRFLTTEQPVLLNKPLDLPALKKNGEQFKAIHLIRAIKKNDQWIIGANIIPVDKE